MANPITIATKGKGYLAVIKRIRAIGGRYGLTPAKMDCALKQFVTILQTYNCGATFPITASVLARNGSIIEKYQAQNIEFAIHGLFHIDHSQLSLTKQLAHIRQSRHIFQQKKINLTGFRCPYLRWNEDTLVAVGENGLGYDSSQALYWEVTQDYDTEDYQRVLAFYGAKSARRYSALPRLKGNVVHIPYCVPDDEALIDRFKLSDAAVMSQIWLAILAQTHQLGELFTLGLHPERINLLAEPLAATLAQARALSPVVWIARLDEIARWWRSRAETKVIMTFSSPHDLQLTIEGPQAVTILSRNLPVNGSTAPWADNYERIMAKTFTLQTTLRPVIGISPKSVESLIDFLRQQGYLFEISEDSRNYPFYLERLDFKPEDERPLLAQIEMGKWPLLRLGRWPDGARSALCVTGDIDALTLWDYGLRFLGN